MIYQQNYICHVTFMNFRKPFEKYTFQKHFHNNICYIVLYKTDFYQTKKPLSNGLIAQPVNCQCPSNDTFFVFSQSHVLVVIINYVSF